MHWTFRHTFSLLLHIVQSTGFHVFRYLVERVVPGNRVSIMGIYSIKKVSQGKAKRV